MSEAELLREGDDWYAVIAEKCPNGAAKISRANPIFVWASLGNNRDVMDLYTFIHIHVGGLAIAPLVERLSPSLKIMI